MIHKDIYSVIKNTVNDSILKVYYHKRHAAIKTPQNTSPLFKYTYLKQPWKSSVMLPFCPESIHTIYLSWSLWGSIRSLGVRSSEQGRCTIPFLPFHQRHSAEHSPYFYHSSQRPSWKRTRDLLHKVAQTTGLALRNILKGINSNLSYFDKCLKFKH